MNKSGWTVYALRDPRDNAIRYIGVTSNIATRMTNHLRDSRPMYNPKKRWLMELGNLGLAPQCEVLEQGDDQDSSRDDSERKWISEFRASGASLTNATDGGKGAAGYVPTAEQRTQNSIRHKGRKRTGEALERMRQAQRLVRAEKSAQLTALNKARAGRVCSQQMRDKISAAHKGKTISPEQRAAISAANRGIRRGGKKPKPVSGPAEVESWGMEQSR